MKVRNYCRDPKGERYYFFADDGARDTPQPPHELLTARGLRWWRPPFKGGTRFEPVWLIGENETERCKRLNHDPGVCASCTTKRAWAARVHGHVS